VLIDNRPGSHKGMVLQHPAFRRILAEKKELPPELANPEYRVDVDSWQESSRKYSDPLERFEQGGDPTPHLVAVQAGVGLKRGPPDATGLPTRLPTGLVVVVQEDIPAISSPLRELADNMFRLGLIALAIVVVVVTCLWYFVVRVLRDSSSSVKRKGAAGGDTTSSLHSMQTVHAPTRPQKT
jgi:hypothetical protein